MDRIWAGGGLGPGSVVAGYRCLWNIATHALIATLTVALHGSDGVSWVAFSPDGDTLAAAEGQGSPNGGQGVAYTYLWHLTE